MQGTRKQGAIGGRIGATLNNYGKQDSEIDSMSLGMAVPPVGGPKENSFGDYKDMFDSQLAKDHKDFMSSQFDEFGSSHKSEKFEFTSGKKCTVCHSLEYFRTGKQLQK